MPTPTGYLTDWRLTIQATPSGGRYEDESGTSLFTISANQLFWNGFHRDLGWNSGTLVAHVVTTVSSVCSWDGRILVIG